MPFAVISTLLNVYNFITNKTQSQVQIFLAAFIVLMFVIWVSFRKTYLRRFTSIILVTFYPIYTGVIVNLALRDWVPFGLQVDLENLPFF